MSLHVPLALTCTEPLTIPGCHFPYSIPHILLTALNCTSMAAAGWFSEVKRLKHLLPIPSASQTAAVGVRAECHIPGRPQHCCQTSGIPLID